MIQMLITFGSVFMIVGFGLVCAASVVWAGDRSMANHLGFSGLVVFVAGLGAVLMMTVGLPAMTTTTVPVEMPVQQVPVPVEPAPLTV